MALARSPQPEPPQASGGLLAWWLGELQALLPRRWREPPPRRGALLLMPDGSLLRVYERRRQRLQALPSLPLAGGGTADREVRQALARHRRAVLLVLRPEDGLACTDILPASAEDALPRIMAHKIDLLTPWPAEQVYAAQRVVKHRADGTIEVLLAAAPRRIVDEARARLTALGLAPTAVDLALDEDFAATGATAGVDLLHAEAAPARGSRIGRRLGAILLLGVLLLGGWAGYEIHLRRQRLLERQAFAAALEQRLADLPGLRAEIEGLRAQADFLAAERRRRPSPVVVLEVLSRLLPDGVWLSELQMEDRELIVTGLAEDASALIPLVEASPHFAQVRFHMPSTRVRVRAADGTEQEVERFSLRAVIDPAAEPGL
jgi:general secretion pathway protein L